MKYEIEIPDAEDAALWEAIKNDAAPGPPDQFGRRAPVPKYNGNGDFFAEIIGQQVAGRIWQRKPTPEVIRIAKEIEDRNAALALLGRPVVTKKAASGAPVGGTR